MGLILEIVSPQVSAPGVVERYTFYEIGGTIGRETDNSWVLPHLAGRHAEVSYANGVFFIRNTSQYDIVLNARLLVPGETWRLKRGDRLFVGPYELGVSVVDSAGLPPMAQDDAGRDLLEGAGIDLSSTLSDGDVFAPAPSRPPSGATPAPREAAAKPSEELDPFALPDPSEGRQVPRKLRPSPWDLDARSPLDAHFRPPIAVPGPAATPSEPNAIPDDYDPLAPDELAPTPPSLPRPQMPSPVAAPPGPDSDPDQRYAHRVSQPPHPRGSVEFSAYFPSVLPPSSWQSIVVYAHVPSARRQVQADSTHFFDGKASPDVSRARARTLIREGAEIQIVPWLPDCEFNPPRASISWMEEWHRVVFRVRTLTSDESSRVGVVRFYVGCVLVGELSIWPAVMDLDTSANTPPAMRSRDAAYQSVFVSYSHDDAVIVDQLQHAYSVLGMAYIRDVNMLRSGEHWNDAIVSAIPSADIFQLCWSHAAKGSRFVEREWRCALGLQRRHFIRPVFWETPIPEPPTELAHLHFAQLQWLQQRT